jgi:hypothetical protein
MSELSLTDSDIQSNRIFVKTLVRLNELSFSAICYKVAFDKILALKDFIDIDQCYISMFFDSKRYFEVDNFSFMHYGNDPVELSEAEKTDARRIALGAALSCLITEIKKEPLLKLLGDLKGENSPLCRKMTDLRAWYVFQALTPNEPTLVK